MTLKANVGDKYSLVIAKAARTDFSNETYWCCFGYEDFIPDDLHCTHKFFGEQTDESVENIKNLLDAYFLEHPFEPFTVSFTEENFFGENKDIRVLKPKILPDNFKETFLLDLRKQLDAFAEDRYPSYQPHVTTDMELVNLPFTRYCFCQGDRIISEFR